MEHPEKKKRKMEKGLKVVMYIGIALFMIGVFVTPFVMMQFGMKSGFILFGILWCTAFILIIVSVCLNASRAKRIRDEQIEYHQKGSFIRKEGGAVSTENISLRQQQERYLKRQEAYHDEDPHRNEEKKDDNLVCYHCGYINPPGSSKCALCNNPLRITCQKCGAKNPPEALFCSSCGAPLKTPDSKKN